MKVFHPAAKRERAQGAFIGVLFLMGLLGAAFFRVQVLGSTTWTLRAESNRLRQLPLPAPRGTVYDRNGAILADNVPGYAITLLPAPPDSIRATLVRMGRYMDMPPERIDRLMAELRRYGRELIVDADADFAVVSALEERRAEFPGVYIEMRPHRRYVGGAATSHVLGYVGEITAEELEDSTFADGRYEQGAVVGKTGIEKEYEGHLQGERGLRYVEVDAKGRIVGDFGGVMSDPAVPGKDLRLNLDLDLQEYIHHIFPDSMAGAVVAMDPADGGVLALYSAPSFDSNEFVGGVDAALWGSLNTDPRKPLYDRAVLGLYAPASTFKLATAAIGLELGVVGPESHMPVACTGGWFWGGRLWHCHKPEGHGSLDLAGAIANSCDVYFYQLGLRIGLDRMLERATGIGFGRKCGVDLPQESQGIFPADRQFWNRRFGYSPQEGEALSLAIGQGPNDQTPLKMAQFYTALARDGSAPAPAIAQGVTLGEGWSLNLKPEHVAALREGLRKVTEPGGTAHYAGTLEHWEVLGKTGTGQNAQSVAGLAADHAWFAAIVGPFGGAPEVVVVVLVEHGESGSRVAAPIATKAADFYLRKKHGIEQDTIQTLGEWIQARGWPEWYRKRYAGGG